MRYDRVFGLFIVFVMVGSLAGIAISNMGGEDTGPTGAVVGDGSFEVNGYYFYEDKTQGSFNALLSSPEGDALEIPFRTDPREIGHIGIDDAALEAITAAQKIYLTHDPNTADYEETKNSIQIALGLTIQKVRLVNNNIYPVGALTADIPGETYDDDVPIKTCADTGEAAIIFFTIAGRDEVRMDGDCIIVSGETGEGLVATADKFGMYLVGLRV